MAGELYILFFLVLMLLISVAFLTLLERKKLASIQHRKGPNKVGIFGFIQPIADGIKLIFKETIMPTNSIISVFIIAPIISFLFGFILWCLMPMGGFSNIGSDLEYSFFIIFIISILHVYSIILGGWASNSKYSFFGSLRSAAQLISYDITIGLIILTIFLFSGTLNIHKLVEFQIANGWLIFYSPLLFILFMICSLAETNRHPFDLPEAESELVSGYNVEYSAVGFALFFLGEYASIIFIVFLNLVLFFGGWDSVFLDFIENIKFNYLLDKNYDLFKPIFILLLFLISLVKIILSLFFIIKFSLIMYLIILIRGILPRYRYDQLMNIGWKVMLPLSFCIFIIYFIIIYFIGNITYELDIPKIFVINSI